ncbi:MAG: hypothetical protein NVS9B10_15840 [Nevskia sp.]
MIFSLSTFTAVHAGLSLVALTAGIFMVTGLARGQILGALSMLYFVTSIVTSVTGFGFPFVRILPSHVVGVLSLIALSAAIFARHREQLGGVWRPIYVGGITVSVYFLALVTVVQAFLKLPSLHSLAPTMGSPLFVVSQLAVLFVFAAMGAAAVRGMRRAALTASAHVA